MAKRLGNLESTIKTNITKFCKDTLGKGPDTTSVHIWENIVIIKFEGALTTLEETLAATEDGLKMVLDMRNYMLDVDSTGFKRWLERELENSIDQICFRLNRDKKTIYLYLMLEDRVDLEVNSND
jgi:uncharacterized protein YbcI